MNLVTVLITKAGNLYGIVNCQPSNLKGALSDLFISYLLNILISCSIVSSKRMK